MVSARVERLLSDDYLGDVRARTIEEIRAMRADCQEIEVGLSYLRRLVHGRLDIVRAEIERRTESGGPSDLATLVARLPEVLAEHTRGAGFGRLPTLLAPSREVEEEMHAELDVAVGDFEPYSLPEQDDAEVRDLGENLTRLERSVSERRRRIHERIDALQAELTRRYKSGEASVESLLR